MYRKKATKRSADPAGLIDWSALDAVRREWPDSDLDPRADLATWRNGSELSNSADINDDRVMAQAGDLMCAALRHNLYNTGILIEADLQFTVHNVVCMATSHPVQQLFPTAQQSRMIRLALTVIKKHHWQPASMGGTGLSDELFANFRLFLEAALSPNNLAPGKRILIGDLLEFFASNPIDQALRVNESDAHRKPSVSLDHHHMTALADLQAVMDEANAGDSAAQARARALAAVVVNGDSETALRNFEESARLGNVDSMYDAGCLNRDLGNRDRGAYWFELAVSAGDARSAHNLGARAAADGNLAVAKEWFRRETELGDPKGYGALSQLAAEAGNTDEALRWSRLGSDAGHAQSADMHCKQLTDPSPGGAAALRAALPFAIRAGDLGEANGYFQAGLIEGDLGHLSEARYWLRQADATGHPRAREVIGHLGL